MKKTIQQKRLDFLNETVNHYNINNRCATTERACRYSPNSLGLKGVSEGCAIGRHLTKELASKLDKALLSDVGELYIFDQLPDNLKELGQDFLNGVQRLHDNNTLWNSEGLSGAGLGAYETLKKQFCIE